MFALEGFFFPIGYADISAYLLIFSSTVAFVNSFGKQTQLVYFQTASFLASSSGTEVQTTLFSSLQETASLLPAHAALVAWNYSVCVGPLIHIMIFSRRCLPDIAAGDLSSIRNWRKLSLFGSTTFRVGAKPMPPNDVIARVEKKGVFINNDKKKVNAYVASP